MSLPAAHNLLDLHREVLGQDVGRPPDQTPSEQKRVSVTTAATLNDDIRLNTNRTTTIYHFISFVVQVGAPGDFLPSNIVLMEFTC